MLNTMLNKNDFKSIWEIAHRWEGLEPPDHEPTELSEGVSDKIQKLIWGYRREQLTLRNHKGLRVSHVNIDGVLDVLLFDRTIFRLNRCLKMKHFPHSLLGRLFVMRSDLLKWCREDFIQMPEFWQEGTEPDSPLRINQRIKIACQVIAEQIWKEEPETTIADMVKHPVLLRFGGRKAYKDDTVRDWLTEIAPESVKNRRGRPKKI